MIRKVVSLVFNRSFGFLSTPVQNLHVRPQSLLSCRRFGAAAAPAKPRVPIQLTFQQIRKELSNPSTLVIDVREPAELTKDGRISNDAKNIPRQLEQAIHLSDEEFQSRYGFSKPNQNQTIVTHCKLGIRATKGAHLLSQAGFQNVIVYPGTVDWVESGGDLLK